jgi:ABC-type branched-chain amino acid transport system, permease component
MRSSGTSTGILPAALAIAVVALFSALLLYIHGQRELVALVVVGGIVLWAAVRSGAVRRIEAAFTVHERALNGVMIAGFLCVIVALRGQDFPLLILATVMLYGTVCLGLTIQLGYCGVMNFAGAAFFGTGCYTAAVLSAHTGMPHVLVLLAAGAMGALMGSLLLLPMLRTSGHYAALVTIAFGILFRSFLEVNDTLGGPQGLTLPGMEIFGWSLNEGLTIGTTTLSFYFNYALLALALLLVAFAVTRRLERSWIGTSLDAVRIDEIAAAAFGLNVPRIKIVAFMIGNAFAGIAGGIFAMMSGFIAPTEFDFGTSLVMIAIIMLGGIGNVWGVLPAAALVLILPEKLQFIQEYRFLLYATAVVLILMFLPGGLFPRRLRRAFFAGGG